MIPTTEILCDETFWLLEVLKAMAPSVIPSAAAGIFYKISSDATTLQLDSIENSTKTRIDSIENSTKARIDSIKESTKAQVDSIEKHIASFEKSIKAQIDSVEKQIIVLGEIIESDKQSTIEMIKASDVKTEKLFHEAFKK